LLFGSSRPRLPIDMTDARHLPASPDFSLDDLEAFLQAARDRTLVVLGDAMLDVRQAGDVERICPEAPVPILTLRHEEAFPGGAANAANNIAPFAKTVRFVSVVGRDESGERLRGLLENERVDCRLIIEASRPTTTKTRLVSASQLLLRCDRESRAPISTDVESALLLEVERALDGAACVLIADYAKGLVSRRVVERVAAMCRERKIPLLADPKQPDLAFYKGASLIKPNRVEAERATGYAIDNPQDAARAAGALLDRTEAQAVLITLGAMGMMLVERDGTQIRETHLPTQARQVFDVTGAGDTTLAMIGLAVATGWSLAAAASLANLAAGITIAKQGTARVEPGELLAAAVDRQHRRGMFDKVVARGDVGALARSLRSTRRRIVFTNGCFDLFHPGHAMLLSQARALGDVLIVGVNSDASVRKIKGAPRPFVELDGRLAILCSLHDVDHVIVYDEDTPISLLEELCPHFLAKGGNYSPDQVVGGDLVRKAGGEVRVIPVAQGHSVTALSQSIRDSLSD